MVVSLLAYFFTMIMAFSAITALLIGVSNHNSGIESALHYPRPEQSIIEQTFPTIDPQARDLPDAPKIKKEEVPAKKDEPNKNKNDSRVLFANADIAKHKHEIKNSPDRLAHLSKPARQREKPRVFARQRNNYERPGYYGNALGYAEQRPFSMW